MAAAIIIVLIVVLGLAAWYAFQHAEPSPRRMREDFERRRAGPIRRDRDPDKQVRGFRWWSR